MAISTNLVGEIRNTADFAGASDTNGGGFVTGASGTDWSQQGSPQYSVTDGVTAGTTTITSITAAFGTDVVGNLISVSGGTGSVAQNWYQIISRTNATTIVVDRSTGLTAGTGVTLKIGGAFASVGGFGAFQAASGAVTSQHAWQKYSTTAYNISSSTSNVSGGIFTCQTNTATWIEGYDVTRGDRTGNRPKNVWTASAPGVLTYIFNGNGNARQGFANFLADGGSVNNVGGFNLNNVRNSAIQSVAQNCNGTAGVGFTGIASAVGTKACAAISCTTGFSLGNTDSCYATGCTTGYVNMTFISKCIAYLNTNGFVSTTSAYAYDRCTSDSNTTNGFNLSAIQGSVSNSIASNQSGGGGVGFLVNGNVTLANCASYNNLTEVSGTPLSNEGMILNASFTGGQPYTVAGSDFRPNSTSGAGALLRGAGIGVYGQTDTVDIGAVQHTDPSGSGGGLSLAGRGGGIAG